MVTKAMVLLGQSDFDELRKLAEAAYPEEFCAILLGCCDHETIRVLEVLVAKNVHANPRTAFSIDPTALIDAQRAARQQGWQIVGFVHSHPDHSATPSHHDLEEAYWIGVAYGIISVQAGKCEAISFYRLTSSTSHERRFVTEEFTIA